MGKGFEEFLIQFIFNDNVEKGVGTVNLVFELG